MEKGIVELPISLEDIACVTECWTYFRLAIIKTSSYYEDWIASHYNLFVDEDLNFYFGETSLLPPSAHDAILERRPLHLFGLSEEDVIEKIKAELLMGNYVLMYMKSEANEKNYHEVLFYGFDDTKCTFLTVGMEEHTFQIIQFSYTYVRDTLSDVKDYFYKDVEAVRILFMNYQYPATVFRINKSYNAENCPFEVYSKLDQELYGGCHRILDAVNFGNYEDVWGVYRGVNCLYGLLQMLQKEINGEKFSLSFRGLVSGVKKLQEHQKLILHAMRYLVKKWNMAMNRSQAENCISEYVWCYEKVEKWVGMILKYEFTNNKELLKGIMTEIPDVFERECKILDKFLHDSIIWEVFNKNFI